MAFDAAALVESVEPPEIRAPRARWLRFLGPKTWRGRVLSHAEFLPFAARFDALQKGQLSDDETRDLIRDYVDAIGIPPRVVTRLPPGVMLAALQSFLRCQMKASGLAIEAAKRTRNGPNASGGAGPLHPTGPGKPWGSKTPERTGKGGRRTA